MLLCTLPQRELLTAGWATSKCRLKPGAGEKRRERRGKTTETGSPILATHQNSPPKNNDN